MGTYTLRPRLKGEERTAVKKTARELYEAGCSIRSVAEQIGRSFGCARTLLLEAGTTLRSRGRFGRRDA